MRIADLCKPFGNREYGEVRWIAVRNLMPGKGRRHARVRQRAHRVGRARCTILCVLVVVQKDAVAFLLPPLRRSQARHAPFDFTRQSERSAADLGECPSLPDRNVDMHASRTARFGPAAKSQLLEK